LIIKKGEKSAMTGSSAGHLRWTNEMLDELADSVSGLRGSVSELRESVSEVRDSVDGVRLTAQALLEIAAQQQRNMDEMRQRQQESDKRFEVLLSEVRYLIRQIKPENQS
jgi:methyl-accepting chemotaxis protein